MNKHAKRTLAAGAACAVGAGLLVGPTAAMAAPIQVDPLSTAVVNLLHFNDFHGRLDVDPAVQFAGTIEQLRADYPAQTLLLSGGDSIGASDFTSASQGDEPTLEMLNLLGVDASAVGNHEFDQGVADLTDRVDPIADFPYLSANVTLDGAPIGPAFETFEVDGVSVAVVGAVTALTPSLVDMSRNVGVEFGDPVAAVNRVAAELTDGDASNGEAEVIVAEIHDGSGLTAAVDASQEEQSAIFAADAASGGVFGDMVDEISADVDVIFNGHAQTTYSWLAPVPGRPGETRPIVQSNEYGNLVGQVVLHIDRETGEVSTALVANHTRIEDDPAALAASLPCVAEVSTLLEQAAEEAALVGNVEVGSISGPITVPDQVNGNRSEESTSAQLVANMYRDQLANADRGGAEIGIVNPGGVRDSFLYEPAGPETEPGIVRLSEANNMLPFINNLWTMTMTGAQLDQLLEEQWQRTEAGEPFTTGRTYLQLGLSDNVTYVSDPSRPMDDRVSGIAIDGAFITPDQEIRIASASFLMGVGGPTSPGDNFWAFDDGVDARDSGLVDFDALVAYLGANAGLAPDYTVRHVDASGLPVAPVAAGESVTLDLNQLDRIRSTGATMSSTVQILDPAGAVVGEAAVAAGTSGVNTPSTLATVTFVPTTSGTYTIVTSNGSEIPFPLETTAAVALSTPAEDVEAVPVEAPEPTQTPAITEETNSDETVTDETVTDETVTDETVTDEATAAVGTDARERVRALAAAVVEPGECAIPRPARSAGPVATPEPTVTAPPVETPGVTTPAPAPGADDGQGGSGSLPRTGAEVSPMLWVGAALLVLLGVGLIVGGRLRRVE